MRETYERWGRKIDRRLPAASRRARLVKSEVPTETEKKVNATRDLTLLSEWFDRASTVATLDDVGILP